MGKGLDSGRKDCSLLLGLVFSILGKEGGISCIYLFNSLRSRICMDGMSVLCDFMVIWVCRGL